MPYSCELLQFGDIVYPVQDKYPIRNFHYIRTISHKYGWIHTNSGISIDYTEDLILYYFGKQFYLKQYQESDGNPQFVDKLNLLKNVVPFLLGNQQNMGWFYPLDYQLALVLAKYGAKNAQDVESHFISSSRRNWLFNEIVISNNLLADCYEKLGFYDTAVNIHNKLLRRYFWKKSYNTNIGGINSLVKTEKIYIDKLKLAIKDSEEYKNLQDKIVWVILWLGDHYNIYTVMDEKWHFTAAEWMLHILLNSVSREEFYQIVDLLINETSNIGFSDMIQVYKAIAMYNDGKKEESLKILVKIKPRNKFKYSLKLDDWLSYQKIVPDSILHQYHF